MQAWAITRQQPITSAADPLTLLEFDTPAEQADQVLLKIHCCGICHTELDEIEGRTIIEQLPRIPGHQVIAHVERVGAAVTSLKAGQRVGVAWIYNACGHCRFCKNGLENLCPQFQATGLHHHGGYAQYMVARADFCHPLPDNLPDELAAPLLCGGAIGYRSLMLGQLNDGDTLGLMGFGASNHLVLRLAKVLYPKSPVQVFARSEQQQHFARQCGASWAGGIDQPPPHRCHAIIDTTPAWTPVTQALKHLEPAGRLVINAIRKKDTDRQQLAELDYPNQLWMEKEIKSVANVTRHDVVQMLSLAAKHPGLLPEVQTYPFSDANQALHDLVSGNNIGAKVLMIDATG